jgi:hypothetical protein
MIQLTQRWKGKLNSFRAAIDEAQIAPWNMTAVHHAQTNASEPLSFSIDWSSITSDTSFSIAVGDRIEAHLPGEMRQHVCPRSSNFWGIVGQQAPNSREGCRSCLRANGGNEEEKKAPV